MVLAPPAKRGPAKDVAAVLVYAVLGVVAFGPILSEPARRLAECACGDPVLSVWFLEWVPRALLHGHNPLFASVLNVPNGVNLAQNTAMPLLDLIMAPVTGLAGPVASYNLLLYLAFPLSAASMFAVLRRWTDSGSAAFVGGLFYGFSPYSTGQGIDHPMFSFVPLLPLILLVVYEIIVVRAGRPFRQGLVLSLLVIAQFFVEPELLADMVLVLAGGLAIVLIWGWRSVTMSMVAYSGRAFALSSVVVGVIVAYPVWFMEFGPQHFVGTVQPVSNPYRSDLLGPVVPTATERIAPSSLLDVGMRITHGELVGNASYLGIPLIVSLLLIVMLCRKNRWVVFCLVVAAIAFVLSLGPTLVIDGDGTGLPLPFDLLDRLPLLGNILPARLALFEDLFVAVAVGLGLADIHRGLRATGQAGRSQAPRPRGLVVAVLISVLLGLVALVPSWPYKTATTDVPPFFSSPSAGGIASGAVVLTYPLAAYPDDQSMLWQAAAAMRFRLIGGYAVQRGASGRADLSPTFLSPRVVETFLSDAALGRPQASSPATEDQLVRSVRRLIRDQDVKTVIVDPVGADPTVVIDLFREVLGPPHLIGGVAVWFVAPPGSGPRTG